MPTMLAASRGLSHDAVPDIVTVAARSPVRAVSVRVVGPGDGDVVGYLDIVTAQRVDDHGAGVIDGA